MNDTRGSIEQRYSRTLCWKVESINSDGKWMSRYIFCPNNLRNFCMLISSVDKKTKSRKLYLCEELVDAPKTYDFVVALKYTHKQEIYVKGNVKPVQSHQWFRYDLENVKTDNLLKITCSFFKRDASIETVFGTDKIEFTEKQEENEEKVSAEQRKTMKGLDSLSKSLREAFLSKEDCDITIKVGDKTYAAHKVILRNRSPVFQKMLQHDMAEKNGALIDITDCDPLAFGDFLLYLYAGKLDTMSKERVFQLYYISDKYDVSDLKLDCVDFILNNLDTDIILDVIKLATTHEEQEMLDHAVTFFTSNAKDIFVTMKWQIFVKEQPIQANKFIIKAFDNVADKHSPEWGKC